jgi:diguanylate cyclase (GGDEF)-like protein
MFDVTHLYLAALISQATFALTLAILAWSDRRTRGTFWLAIACAMQFSWTTLRSLSPGHTGARIEEFSACLLVVLVYIVFVGVRWFACRRGITDSRELVAIGACILAIALACALSSAFAVQVSRCIALGLGIRTIVLLWNTPFKGLITPARITGVLLALIMVVIALNFANQLPMSSGAHAGHETETILVLRGCTILLITLLSFSFIGLFVGETNFRLQQDSRTDSLTTLRNRRAIEEVAVREVRVAQRTHGPLALLMMDLDHFKALNDTWGHSFGDHALRSVGVALQSEAGVRDVSARMGGEEFALLLPGRTLVEAAAIAERIRSVIADLPLSHSGQNFPLTISIGVSVLRRGEQNWIEMLCRADTALYRAKRDGRNRVEQCNAGTLDSEGSYLAQTAAHLQHKRRWRSRILAAKHLF